MTSQQQDTPSRTSPTKRAEVVDNICDAFERAWQAGQQPKIENYLDEADQRLRGHLLEELLLSDLRLQIGSGTTPDRDDYVRRFPECAELIDGTIVQADKVSTALSRRGTMSRSADSGSGRGLSVRCPHCHNPIEVVVDARLDDITCSTCGSHFSLVQEETTTRDASKITTVGHFELIERLGLGGFGTVWKARDTQLDRTVAVKIPRHVQLGPVDTEKFLREARAIAQLNHPNIVRVYEVGRDGETAYIVSDLVRGVSLADRITAGSPTAREAAELCAKIADALAHAHEAGVVHRDLKPQNIMIDANGEPILMDFGLARRDAGEVTVTVDGQLLGTPAYMSPEQARGEAHHADHRTDLYSLGVILFELLTGERPFRGSARMIVHQVITDEAPSPRKLNANLPSDLETICLKCLEKDPRNRYSTASDVAEELRRYLSGQPIVARRITHVGRAWRWCKRNPVPAFLSIAIAVSLLVGTSASLWQSRQARIESARAVSNEKRAKRNEYIAVMNLIQSEWRDGNVTNVRALLKETSTYADRGFEWYYWLHKTHEERRTMFGHVGKIYSVAFSPDGRHVVSGGNDQVARVWEVATGKQRMTLNADAAGSFEMLPREYGINGVGFSPDGKSIVTCSLDKTAASWDAQTGKERFRMIGHTGPAWTVAFSRDNTKIATTSQDGTVIVWNAATGKELFTLYGHNGNSVFGVAFSPDSSKIVTGGSDHEAVVWDASDGSELFSLSGHTNWVFSVAYSPDGTTIATASHDGTIRFWDGQDGRQLPTICTGHEGHVKCVKFSPDGSKIVTGGVDATARLWDVDTGNLLKILRGHEDQIWSVDFSTLGQIVTCSYDGTVKIWDTPVAPGHFVVANSLPVESEDHVDSSLAFFRDGGRIAIGSWDHTVSIVDVQTATRLHHLKDHTNRVWSVALSPDDQFLLTGGWDNKAILWDAVSGKKLTKVDGHSGGVRAVDFSPDGKTMATASEDSTIQIWNVASRSRLQSIRAHGGAVWAVAFSPDGRWIVSGGADKTCRIWDVESGSKRHELTEHGGAVKTVAVTSDNIVLTGSDDRICRVWDPSSGNVRTLEGHRDTITRVGISNDGSRYITASRDSQVKLWDAVTGREVLTLRGNRIDSVAMSHDGLWIAAAGHGTPFLWKAASEEQSRAWSDEQANALRTVAERKAELDAVFEAKRARRQQDPGAIKDWLILAPIPVVLGNDDEATGLLNALTRRTRFDVELQPQANQILAIDGQDLIWQRRSLDDFHIDFNAVIGQQSPWSLAYAVCYIVSDEKQTGVQLRIGSDDQSQILLNGKEVYIHEHTRSYLADTDTVPDLTLEEGINRLVFKVANGVGGWDGSVRLTQQNGNPVPGINVTIDPIVDRR